MEKENILTQQEEVNKNFTYFQKNIKIIHEKYPKKKYILLKNQNVIGGFDSWDDAEETANILLKKEKSKTYSIQELNPQPINLGYQAYALL